MAFYLFSGGTWVVSTELFIISLVLTFNPSYPMFNLQVIWAIGISMIVLSALIYLNRRIILAAILLIAAHNLLNNVHVPGMCQPAFFWSLLHEDGDFIFGHFNILVHYPVIPSTGIIALGCCFGSFYDPDYGAAKRNKLLLAIGSTAVAVFFFCGPLIFMVMRPIGLCKKMLASACSHC